MRGGAWDNDPGRCRTASRSFSDPGGLSNSLGFRVCCGAPIELLGAGSLDAETLDS
jgi:hypothetical protein